MKYAFISVSMNLIYGKGPVNNSSQSKSKAKSFICCSYCAIITMSLFSR